jgi:hypothetical protein
MSAFMEDWNASQFWYTQETADTLAREMLKGATAADAIAFVSAPSAFIAAKNMWAKMEPGDRPGLSLLEYDERFAIFPEFVRYDYNNPFQLPSTLRRSFTRIICDPPFLSDECQTKMALTIHWLAADPAAPPPTDSTSLKSLWLAISTGERVGPMIRKLYGKKGVKTTNFEVQHQKGLSNEFHLYSNFTTDSWNMLSEKEYIAQELQYQLDDSKSELNNILELEN